MKNENRRFFSLEKYHARDRENQMPRLIVSNAI